MEQEGSTGSKGAGDFLVGFRKKEWNRRKG